MASEQAALVEVRSYRAVFALERRIYRLDRFRLNPAGVPLRGIAYALVLVLASVGAGRLPFASFLPWYLRDGAFPVALAALLTASRVDGRSVHVAAGAFARWLVGRRALSGLAPVGRSPRRWRPPPMLLIPDGSDAAVRPMRYRGPGVVLITQAHTRTQSRRAPHLRIRTHAIEARSGRPTMLDIAPGRTIEVRPPRPTER